MTERLGLRVALVDDHPAILRAVMGEITAAFHVAEVVRARHVDEILATPGPYEVVVLDVQLADDSDPADNVRRIAERGWPVLLYTQETNARMVARCFRAGAKGIVGKSQDLADLLEAVGLIANGQPYLSGEWAAALSSDAAAIPSLAPREAEALRMYASGLPMKSVARRMGISPETVKDYLMRVRRRYDEVGRPAATKTELYVRAVEDGLVEPPASLS
jgi:DNA-binding NarL/FixJ family response regulator